MPSTSASAFRLATSDEDLLSLVSAGKPDVARVDPRLRCGLVLRRDVDVRRGIVTDEHRRETDVAELGNLARDAFAYLGGELLPVHAHGRHRGRLYAKAHPCERLNQRPAGADTCRRPGATGSVA